MIEKYAKNIEHITKESSRPNVQLRHQVLLDVIDKKKDKLIKVLDVGERNPFTEKVERRFDIKVDNTSGDLDENFAAPGNNYDFIILSHVIEHVFNPLHLLQELRKLLNEDGILLIALPDRGKILWTDNHFHEIDHGRMKLLLQRADLNIISMQKFKVKRNLGYYLKGFKPLLRLFKEYQKVYLVEKSKGQNI